ncbi:creatininase family protein [Thiofaba sp. EF100]|uniref:creatininase family protein n=1 Tax=Thiofaba sp. EF100 TaxID=3121274 RepID=UPI003221DEAA
MTNSYPLPDGAPVRWAELRWEDIAALPPAGIDMAILPVGATEQHGPHLPVGVDTLSAVAVAEGASTLTGIPVLPALSYGCSLGHSTQWAGTLSLRPETLSRMVLEIAEWVHAAGFRRLLLLNGHVTNWAPLRCALENIRHDIPTMRISLRSLWDISTEVRRQYHQDAENFHANCAETSLMLALHPELVRMDKAVDEPDRSAGCFFSYRVDQECLHGVVGQPSRASATEGRELLERCVRSLAAQLEKALHETTPLEMWHDALI